MANNVKDGTLVLSAGNPFSYLINNIRASGRHPTRVLGGFVAAWAMFALIL